MERINYILVMFPGGEHSVARMGCFREIFDGKIENAEVVDNSFWKMSTKQQIRFIESYQKLDSKNIVIFIPGAKFLKFTPKDTVRGLKCLTDGPDAVICYLLDGIERQAKNLKISVSECRKIFDCFDIVYSYDLYEADKYNYIYQPAPLKQFVYEDAVEVTSPKMFFCGRAKGRLKLLEKIADSAEKNKIAYEFLVLADRETEGQVDHGGIKFISYIIYDDLVKKIQEASCLVSLVAKGNNMTSLSYNEAIMYNKLLLTNCAFLEKNLHYNENYMKSFKSVDELDFEWIKNNFTKEQIDYKYDGYYSAEYFLKKIGQDYNRGFLKKVSILNKDKIIYEKKEIRYDVHFSKIGWKNDNANGVKVSSLNSIEAFRLKGFQNRGIKVEIFQEKLGMSHYDIEQEECVIIGETGKSAPIKEIRIICDSEKDYDIQYRVKFSELGWSKWYNSGETCGSRNLDNVLIIGIQIIMLDGK